MTEAMSPEEEQAERELIALQLDIMLAVVAVELNAQERKERSREQRDRARDWTLKAS